MAALYGLLLWGIYAGQDSKIYYPPPSSPVPFDVSFPRGDVTLGGWVAPGRGPGTLVVFGGNGQALVGWKYRMGLSRCTDRTLVLVPYRGYEGNPGRPREADLVADGKAVVAWAQAQGGPVAVFGVSLGSGVATAVAADPAVEVDAVLLGTPFDSLANVAADVLPWVLPRLLLRDPYASIDRVGQIRAPVWVLRADRDTLVGPARTQALLQALGTRGHETVVAGDHDSAWGTLEACAWLQQASAVAPSRSAP